MIIHLEQHLEHMDFIHYQILLVLLLLDIGLEQLGVVV